MSEKILVTSYDEIKVGDELWMPKYWKERNSIVVLRVGDHPTIPGRMGFQYETLNHRDGKTSSDGKAFWRRDDMEMYIEKGILFKSVVYLEYDPKQQGDREDDV